MSDEIQHYGVKGMKWGVRKDNPNYSKDQRMRDTEVYGRRGSRRINNAMNKGASVSTARSKEKTRRDRVYNKEPYIRTAGKAVTAAGGIVAANAAISGLRKISKSGKLRTALVNALPGDSTAAVNTGMDYLNAASAALDTVPARTVISGVVGVGGGKIGGDIAVNTNRRIHGYKPGRKR